MYMEEPDTQTAMKLLKAMNSATVLQGMPALYELCSIDKVLRAGPPPGTPSSASGVEQIAGRPLQSV